jgi:palmitoyltransferase
LTYIRSALFGIFTLAMFPSHVHLILTGRTTVESYRGRDQVEQEDRILQMEYGYLWHNQDKRKVRKKWKEEWGGTSVDERWKWGQANELWRQEMGDSWIGWICESLEGAQGQGRS